MILMGGDALKTAPPPVKSPKGRALPPLFGPLRPSIIMETFPLPLLACHQLQLIPRGDTWFAANFL
jgi:hypothetical protein